MREAIAGGWGTLAAMIRAHAFRDGLLMEGELLLGDAERLLEDEHVFVWIDVEQPDGTVLQRIDLPAAPGQKAQHEGDRTEE